MKTTVRIPDELYWRMKERMTVMRISAEQQAFTEAVEWWVGSEEQYQNRSSSPNLDEANKRRISSNVTGSFEDRDRSPWLQRAIDVLHSDNPVAVEALKRTLLLCENFLRAVGQDAASIIAASGSVDPDAIEAKLAANDRELVDEAKADHVGQPSARTKARPAVPRKAGPK